MLDDLPDDCSIEDVQYRLYVIDSIQRGIADADQGQVVSHDHVKLELRRRWATGAGK